MRWFKGRSGFTAESGVRQVGKSESYKEVKRIVGSLRDCHLAGWHLERLRRASTVPDQGWKMGSREWPAMSYVVEVRVAGH